MTHQNQPPPARRQFLKTTIGVSGLTLLGGGAMAYLFSLNRTPARSEVHWLEKTEWDQMDDTASLVKGPFLIRKRDNKPWVIDLHCRHLGCVVHLNQTQTELVCPCHHSRYRTDGSFVAGPAGNPLRPARVERIGDRWRILPARERT